MIPVIHTTGPVTLNAAATPISLRFGAETQKTSHKDPFHDRHRISLVVNRLRDIRQTRSVSLREVSRRARVSEEVIDLAESGKLMPNSRIFKAWCQALNLSWEQVWRDCYDY